MFKMSNEEFLKKLKNAVGNEYTALEEYINSNTKILMRHNRCNYEWKVSPNMFLNNHTRCPKCSGKLKKTAEEFRKEVYELVGDEYTVLGTYKNNSTKIKFRHNKCNKEFMMNANHFLSNNRCPYCANKNTAKKLSKPTNEFKKEVYELVGDEYTVLGEYINNKTKIKLLHNKCNKEWEVKPNLFLNGSRCPHCVRKKVYLNQMDTTETFKDKVYNLVGNEYTVLSEYISSREKISFKHNKCNRIFKMRPNNFQQGQRCPYCNESKGEKYIEEFLINNNIKYEKEKRFKDCKYKRTLPFDFYLEDYNLCIEFDGKQHFEESYYGNCLEQQKLRDKIKNEYCNKNNIELLRIPYNNIDNIDEQILLMINNIKNKS